MWSDGREGTGGKLGASIARGSQFDTRPPEWIIRLFNNDSVDRRMVNWKQPHTVLEYRNLPSSLYMEVQRGLGASYLPSYKSSAESRGRCLEMLRASSECSCVVMCRVTHLVTTHTIQCNYAHGLETIITSQSGCL
jgi:hypothetical protein